MNPFQTAAYNSTFCKVRFLMCKHLKVPNFLLKVHQQQKTMKIFPCTTVHFRLLHSKIKYCGGIENVHTQPHFAHKRVGSLSNQSTNPFVLIHYVYYSSWRLQNAQVDLMAGMEKRKLGGGSKKTLVHPPQLPLSNNDYIILATKQP